MVDEQLEVLEGVAEELVFRREDTGLTVLDISTEDGDLITVVGVLPARNCACRATGTPTPPSAASSGRNCANGGCRARWPRC